MLGQTRTEPAWTRRRLLAASGGLAALVALGRFPGDQVSAAPRLQAYPFRLGVASGDPTSHGVVL
jgi:alkaline phosphatase D